MINELTRRSLQLLSGWCVNLLAGQPGSQLDGEGEGEGRRGEREEWKVQRCDTVYITVTGREEDERCVWLCIP